MSSGIRTSFRTASSTVHENPSMDSLYAACAERFAHPTYHIRCDDAASTIWVSREGRRLEVGIQAHTVGRRGLAAVLDGTEAKLRA